MAAISISSCFWGILGSAGGIDWPCNEDIINPIMNLSRDLKKHDFFTYAKTKTQIKRLCFRYLDSTIPLLSKSEISSL